MVPPHGDCFDSCVLHLRSRGRTAKHVFGLILHDVHADVCIGGTNLLLLEVQLPADTETGSRELPNCSKHMHPKSISTTPHGRTTMETLPHSGADQAMAKFNNIAHLALKVCCYCNGISEGILELRLILKIHPRGRRAGQKHMPPQVHQEGITPKNSFLRVAEATAPCSQIFGPRPRPLLRFVGKSRATGCP